MRFRVFESRKEHEKKLEWHSWYAWRPVEIDGEIVWLERVKES